MKIYFAGPNVFHPKAKEMEEEIRAYCESIGIEALIPGDSGIDWTNPDTAFIAKTIFEINRNHIDRCDAVVANTTPFRGACIDDGTAWEIGYAYALNKPIVSYASGPITTGDTIASLCGVDTKFSSPRRDLNGELIEEFGLQCNLMISCAVKKHFHCSRPYSDSILTAVKEPIQWLITTTKDQHL